MKEPLLRRSAFDIVIMQAYIHATHSLSRRQIRRKDRLSVMRACSYWRGAKYLHAGRESEQERERERESARRTWITLLDCVAGIA